MDKTTKKLLLGIPNRVKGTKTGRQLTFTNYTRKDLMYRKDGRVYGNWQPSFGAACVVAVEAYLPEAAIIRLQELGKCDGNGSTIIMCENY